MTNPVQNPIRNTHPMILIAASSLTIASLAALASFAGWLPAGQSAPVTPPAQVAMAPQAAVPIVPAASEKAVAPSPPSASSPAEERPARRAAVPHRAVTKVAALPPPAPASVPETPNYGNRGATPVANTPANDSGIYVENSRQAQSICHDCGTIQGIREIAQEGQGTGLGAVAGTVLGGILGHQVGNGSGRDVATVVGALGGAFAGHTVEKNARSTRQYEITVRLDDGSMRTITETQQPQWHSGERVRISNNRIANL